VTTYRVAGDRQGAVPAFDAAPVHRMMRRQVPLVMRTPPRSARGERADSVPGVLAHHAKVADADPVEGGLPWWRPDGGQSADDQVDAVWETMR
jgi:hypothetical protein